MYTLPECVYILCFVPFIPLWLFLFNFLSFLRFCGYILYKPSGDLTRPLGNQGVLKGLLHTLNVIMIPMKVSEMFSLVSIFVLLEDEQKVNVRVFVTPIFELILLLI